MKLVHDQEEITKEDAQFSVGKNFGFLAKEPASNYQTIK